MLKRNDRMILFSLSLSQIQMCFFSLAVRFPVLKEWAHTFFVVVAEADVCIIEKFCGHLECVKIMIKIRSI